jgi:putative redox protein
MPEKIIEAHVRETRESAYAVEIVVDGHLVKGDEPVADGGGNLGPNPHDIILASLGACTAITVRWYAIRHKMPLDSVDVALTDRRKHVEGRDGLADVFTKSVRLEGAALTDADRAKLVEVANKCPIQRLLEGSPVIRTSELA